MPIIHATEATDFATHGSRFTSYVRPASGSSELCAWFLDVPASLSGADHRPTREEVLLVLSGFLTVSIDGVAEVLGEGDVALVPAGATFRVDGGAVDARAWVTTTVGLEAVLDDGSRLAPPWAN